MAEICRQLRMEPDRFRREGSSRAISTVREAVKAQNRARTSEGNTAAVEEAESNALAQ